MSSCDPSNDRGRGRGRGKGRGQKNKHQPSRPGRDSSKADGITKKPGYQVRSRSNTYIEVGEDTVLYILYKFAIDKLLEALSWVGCVCVCVCVCVWGGMILSLHVLCNLFDF